ncbi:MAG TPA: uridine diphosphate-N-acetylglucosamine-binding protein YvcK [Terriglobales bacterium]|jgi:uncharacterized cofD-like protein|nr:uridine diphosphate-N-acetylglucosamine-binding protein YvcK [Terriglobales bacterium]
MPGQNSDPISSPGNLFPKGRRLLRVVAMGGGTGLSTLLKGLKHYVGAPPGAKPPSTPVLIGELTAVVTVTDDGGSSGRLRKDLKVLPPGDIRNCIVALSEDEALLSRLFQYRFPSGSKLGGHSFGNLFVTALAAVTGDFAAAVKLSSEVLATRGHIFPATTANVQLEASMKDGRRVRGETKITASQGGIKRLRLVPANARPLPQTVDAVRRADLITIGPGSLFTSLIPNLLVKGIAEAIANSPAVKVLVCNLMTQSNESLGLSAADHIRAIYDHARHPIFDYALVNTKPVSDELKSKYAREGASQIVGDTKKIEALGVRVIQGDYLEEAGVARHATERVARELVALAMGTYAAQSGSGQGQSFKALARRANTAD